MKDQTNLGIDTQKKAKRGVMNQAKERQSQRSGV